MMGEGLTEEQVPRPFTVVKSNYRGMKTNMQEQFDNLIYGKEHQSFKAKVALSAANKLDSQIKTLKVKLDADITPIQKALQNTYQTISGTESGSLYDFLLSLKALGFCIRPSNSLVEIETSLTSELSKSFKESVLDVINDESLPKEFSLLSVFKALSTPRRKDNGAFPEFNVESLTNHFIPRFGGKNQDSKETLFAQFVTSFSQSIADSFTNWEEYNSVATEGEGKKLFTETANQKGIEFSFDFKGLEVKPFPVKSSTVFYNPENVRITGCDKDYRLHIAAALSLFDGRVGAVSKPNEAAKLSKDNLTTTNGNALSWLFNKGLEYFQTTEPSQIAIDYKCPVEVAEKVYSLAKKVPLNHALGKGYSEYRTTPQGQIDSWISNYFKRLFDIQNILDKKLISNFVLPDALGEEKANYFFNFMPMDYKGLASLTKKLSEKENKSLSDIKVLTGAEPIPESFDLTQAIKGVDSFQNEVNAFIGIVNQLKNRIEQEIQYAQKDKRAEDLRFAESCHFGFSLESLDKIPQRAVEAIDAQKDLKEHAKQMMTLLEISSQNLEAILKATDSYNDPMKMMELREQNHLNRLKNNDSSAAIQAKRHVWHYVVGNLRNLSDSTKKESAKLIKDLGLFTSNKVMTKKNKPHSTFNKFFFNREGAIYYSLFSKRRNKPYGIDLELDPYKESKDILAKLEQFALTSACSEKRSQRSETFIKDWVMIQRIRFNLEMNRLPETVKSKLLIDTGIVETDNFPVQYAVALSASDNVGGDTARKILNHYISLISRSMSFVFRESFALKMEFAVNKEHGMVWKAKDKPWKLPKTASSNTELMALSSDGCTIEHSALTGKESANVYQNYPYDLMAIPPFKTGEKLGGATYFFGSKKGLSNKKVAADVCRIIAPSKYKKYFLDALLKEGVELSRPSFLFEGLIQQSIQFNLKKDKVIGFDVELSEPVWSVYLAQPFSIHPKALSDGEILPIFNNMVALDLGEVGVGFTVFDARTQEIIAQGHKRLPSLAKLPKMVRTGRKNRQPRQGFKQVFSTKLVEARKHAVGELKFLIDNLMNQYQAFPVFESTVPNLQSGSREIETVYKNIMLYYTFSNVSAHKSERSSNWYSADRWEHPFLEVQEKVEKKGKFILKTDQKGNPVYKKLNLFPGAVVNPAGTSQVCSCCGINPYELVREYFRNTEDKTIMLDSNGVITLEKGVQLQLQKRFAVEDLPEEEVKDLRRRNRRLPWGKSYRPGKYKESEILKMLRMSVRRPHDNLRSKDTSQSQYHCANTECGSHQHADINASINIGQKWFKTTRVI